MDKVLLFGFAIRVIIGYKFRQEYFELGDGFLEKYSQFLNAISFLLFMVAVNINNNYELPIYFGWIAFILIAIIFVLTAKAAKRVGVKMDALEDENKKEA